MAQLDRLALMCLVQADAGDGRLVAARLVPMQVRRCRLNRAAAADARWLGERLNRIGAAFGTRVEPGGDNRLLLRWR